jgi:RNA polymerase sigma-70 factor (ECF subfamily)
VRTGKGPTARDVFEILAREHTDMLTAYLRSLVWSPGAVDDIFQEAMLIAWRRLADYDRSMPFGPWLRGIAQKLVLEYRRKDRAAATTVDPQVLAELDLRFETVSRGSGDQFRARAERLFTCLSRLPENMRDAIDLVYIRGLLMTAAASALNSSEEAIKKRVQRARQLLAECLRGQEAGT